MDKPDEKETKAKEEPKRLPVQVVGVKEGSALVEWQDEAGQIRRAYMPESKIKEASVAVRDLDKGIPYGLPWEKWIKVTATPESIANELRRWGVWTWEDVNKHALGAANQAFDLGAFLRRVNQEVNK